MSLSLRALSKRFAGQTAVADVSLDVPKGTLVCLLGPSGCGKTTLLRMIAGLEEPSSGRVLLDGTDITALPTHRRGLGMVFQSLALFPHLDVAGNIAYPLAIRGAGRAEREARVTALLDLVRLPGLGSRGITALSGGQRQRVAIARALALDPALLLLDEPLSALDAKLRETMQVELRQLHDRLGITTIVVTHDQREAMTLADLVVVMAEGRVRQAGPPLEVYRAPADAFVAGFIGQTNLVPAASAAALGLPAGPGPLSLRPEDVGLAPAGAGPAARVVFVRDLGASVEVMLEAGGLALTALLPPGARAGLEPGAMVALRIDPASARRLPA